MTSYNGYLSSLQTLHPLQPPGEAKEATRCQEEAAASRHVLVDVILSKCCRILLCSRS
jgi:hypothetical protein